MPTLWNEDEHAQFAVSLGYLTQAKANEWLARRDATVGVDKGLGPLLLEEGVITEAQWAMMQNLMGRPAEASQAGNPDYQRYLACKQAARQGDMEACERLLAEIEDPEYRYRAEIQTLKAQNVREQIAKQEQE
jgi:hypothetical protein